MAKYGPSVSALRKTRTVLVTDFSVHAKSNQGRYTTIPDGLHGYSTWTQLEVFNPDSPGLKSTGKRDTLCRALKAAAKYKYIEDASSPRLGLSQ